MSKHKNLRWDGITLYNGNCLDILDSIMPVDTVITDPVWPNCPDNLLPGADDPEGLLRAALEKIASKRLVVIMRHDSDPRFLKAVPSKWSFFRVQILPYVMPGYIGRKLGGDELAYCFGEPLPSAPGRRIIPGYAPKVQPRDRLPNGHPCSRALTHIKWLVNWWSLQGEIVLDPFMGSGTTGIACVELGRRFIGIELVREYFEIARRQIFKAKFINPPLILPEHQQLELMR